MTDDLGNLSTDFGTNPDADLSPRLLSSFSIAIVKYQNTTVSHTESQDEWGNLQFNYSEGGINVKFELESWKYMWTDCELGSPEYLEKWRELYDALLDGSFAEINFNSEKLTVRNRTLTVEFASSEPDYCASISIPATRCLDPLEAFIDKVLSKT